MAMRTRVGLLGAETGFREDPQHGPSVLGANEEVQVVRPAGPAEDAGGDAPTSKIRQAALVGSAQRVRQHLQEDPLVVIRGSWAGALRSP
jgi:hypothetical protein